MAKEMKSLPNPESFQCDSTEGAPRSELKRTTILRSFQHECNSELLLKRWPASNSTACSELS